MAGSPLSSTQHSGSFSRALLVAAMVAVLYGALLVAIDGFMSLIFDRDVIVEEDAGPLVGPIMAMVAVAVVFVSVLGGLRPTVGRRPVPVVRAVGTFVLVYVLGPLVGSVAYALGQDQLFTGLDFFGQYLFSPFVIASAVLAGATILFLPVIATARSRAR